jgi:hypothetical protein
MTVHNFQKFHNNQVLPLCTQQIDWTLHFQTQSDRVSVPEKFAK